MQLCRELIKPLNDTIVYQRAWISPKSDQNDLILSKYRLIERFKWKLPLQTYKRTRQWSLCASVFASLRIHYNRTHYAHSPRVNINRAKNIWGRGEKCLERGLTAGSVSSLGIRFKCMAEYAVKYAHPAARGPCVWLTFSTWRHGQE